MNEEEVVRVNVGDKFLHGQCGQIHELIPCDDGSTSLLFFQCGENHYVAAIDGGWVYGDFEKIE